MRLKFTLLFKNIWPLAVLVIASTMSVPKSASAQIATARPCDLIAASTPYVAAIRTTRALYRAYTGPLYLVTRQSDHDHKNIGLLGNADLANTSGHHSRDQVALRLGDDDAKFVQIGSARPPIASATSPFTYSLSNSAT